MPKVVGDGASSTKYFCDNLYTFIPTTEVLRGVLFGGYASRGAHAGFVYVNSSNTPLATYSYFGSRLCFITKNNN